MDNKAKRTPIYRIAVLGMSQVGKTSIVNQLVNNFTSILQSETDNDLRMYRKLIDLNHSAEDPQFIVLNIEDM